MKPLPEHQRLHNLGLGDSQYHDLQLHKIPSSKLNMKPLHVGYNIYCLIPFIKHSEHRSKKITY